MKTNTIKSLTKLFLGALTVTPLTAATITWTADQTTITSDADIDLTGTHVRAGTWGSTAVTVDLGSESILFNDEVINDTGAPISVTAFAGTGENSNGSYFNSAGTTVSAEFETVLDSLAWDGPNPKILTLNSLTVGEVYQIQLFVSDDRGCCGGRDQFWSDNSAIGAGNETSTAPHGNSTYVIGRFTADAVSQEIYGFGDSQAQNALNGYVLRSVPEPSAALLSTLAGLALLRRRR